MLILNQLECNLVIHKRALRKEEKKTRHQTEEKKSQKYFQILYQYIISRKKNHLQNALRRKRQQIRTRTTWRMLSNITVSCAHEWMWFGQIMRLNSYYSLQLLAMINCVLIYLVCFFFIFHLNNASIKYQYDQFMFFFSQFIPR